MTRITIDDSMLKKLQNLTQPLELVDLSGKVLARVMPARQDDQLEEPEISEEELVRREQSSEWYTTDQVLAHLKSLEQN